MDNKIYAARTLKVAEAIATALVSEMETYQDASVVFGAAYVREIVPSTLDRGLGDKLDERCREPFIRKLLSIWRAREIDRRADMVYRAAIEQMRNELDNMGLEADIETAHIVFRTHSLPRQSSMPKYPTRAAMEFNNEA